MIRKGWALAASEADAVSLVWGTVVEQLPPGASTALMSKGVGFFAESELRSLWASWGDGEGSRRERYPQGYHVTWVWERPKCSPEHRHNVRTGDGLCPKIKTRRYVDRLELWNTPSGYPARQDDVCKAAMDAGICCAVCFYGNLPERVVGNGLCSAHADEDFNKYTQVE